MSSAGLVSILLGLSLEFIFLEMDSASVVRVFGILSFDERCFFGMIRAWPFERGFNSRTARDVVFSPILYEGISSEVIEQKIHFWFCCIAMSFFCKKSSSSSGLIDSIWLIANSCLSSGKMDATLSMSCFFISAVCSSLSIVFIQRLFACRLFLRS